MKAEFSMLLPDGSRSAIRTPGVVSAFRQALAANRSRAARGLPLVRLLHRPSGWEITVPPDADACELADAWAAHVHHLQQFTTSSTTGALVPEK